MKKRANLKISGVVQGVFYRVSAKEKAESLEITGTIRNLANGEVEIIIEGEEGDLKEFITWSKEGPQHAAVQNVSVEYHDFKGSYKDFKIVH